jgi:hypothetical protein
MSPPRQAGRAKEPAGHTFAHLAVVRLRVTWRKTRFWCGNQACQTQAFAESGPVARPRAAVSDPGRSTMGHLVGDWLVPVSRAAAAAGVSWHTAHQDFIGVAAEAGICVEDTKVSAQPDPQPQPGPQPQPDHERSRGGGPRVATHPGKSQPASPSPPRPDHPELHAIGLR